MTIQMSRRSWERQTLAVKLPQIWQRVIRNVEVLLAPVILALILGMWELLVRVGGYPSFILPSPGRVWDKFLVVVMDGTLWRHTRITLLEIAGGLSLGLTAALVIGYGLAKSPLLERLLSPYIIASQSVPVVTIAPLVVIWFGFGALSKVLICALTVFFPMLVNTVIGIRSVEPDLLALMRSLRATRWQTFRLLEVPAALPVLFGGLKVAVTLAVIGAVVGEFVGADRGLGFLLNLARGILDTPLLFVALFTLILIALSLYLTVSWLELWLLRWRRIE
ncbi:MAG: ABC transporter permease [Anaerolineae bacterium]|nr:ABC transporter permease [Anaerolineae bacterium]MDW8098528.1 ABC transporter permease [Anaerolineae bacterium]